MVLLQKKLIRNPISRDTVITTDYVEKYSFTELPIAGLGKPTLRAPPEDADLTALQVDLFEGDIRGVDPGAVKLIVRLFLI